MPAAVANTIIPLRPQVAPANPPDPALTLQIVTGGPPETSNLFQCRARRVVVADPLAIGRKEDAAGHPVGASDRNGLQLVDQAHVTTGAFHLGSRH